MENQKGSVRSQGQGSKISSSMKQIKNILWQEAHLLTERPSMFEVVILNNDVTPMDYVVQSLQEHFYKSYDEAKKLTMKIHQEGEGVCASYTREVAETKTAEVIESARRLNHSLKCIMRKVK